MSIENSTKKLPRVTQRRKHHCQNRKTVNRLKTWVVTRSHAVARKIRDPIHVSAHLITLSPTNLVKLGLCKASRKVTRLGSTCLEGDMDIRNTLLVEVGARLGVEVYARIASAYIAAGIDVFSNPHPGLQHHNGLTDEHLALASEHGDIHTAVMWYLKWCSESSLPPDHEGSFNTLCFRKMYSYLNRSRDDLVFDPDKTDWESRLSVAIAFAFQKNIVCRHGNRCVTCFIKEDSKRVDVDTPLAFLNAEIDFGAVGVLL